jgi:GNAT superfamily N-acetyltransferase
MAAVSGPEGSWHVEVISKDEAGKQLVLSKFKLFRLTALRLDPACEKFSTGCIFRATWSCSVLICVAFSSTLAREEAFADEVWASRLMSPQNHLIVAMDNSSQDIVCAAFLRELSSAEAGGQAVTSSLLFGIYGLWTLPSARRKGIALAVLEEAKKLAADDTSSSSRECLLEVEAYEENTGAIMLYQKAGFVASPRPENGFVKLTLALGSE